MGKKLSGKKIVPFLLRLTFDIMACFIFADYRRIINALFDNETLDIAYGVLKDNPEDDTWLEDIAHAPLTGPNLDIFGLTYIPVATLTSLPALHSSDKILEA